VHVAVDIKKFTANIGKLGGPAKNSFFAVEIATPGFSAATAESLMYLCEAAQLPGMQLGTEDSFRPGGFGPSENMPWGVMFDPVQLTFIGDNSGFIYSTFVSWLTTISQWNSPNIHASFA